MTEKENISCMTSEKKRENRWTGFMIGYAGWLVILFVAGSYTKEESLYGSVTFGANYHVINCLVTVTIYIDHQKIGKLESYTNPLADCYQPDCITRTLPPGPHTYQVEIRGETGNTCMKDISGSFEIFENECERIFIDFFQIYDKD